MGKAVYKSRPLRDVLDVSAVDFDNVEEINAFASLLISLGSSLGVLKSKTPQQSKDAVTVYQSAKGWVNSVRMRLMIMSPSEALSVIEAYEIMYRIANWCDKNPEEACKVKLSAFDAMLHGDESVDRYMMFRIIRKAVRQKEKAFLDKPLAWSCLAERRWYLEACEGFDRSQLSDYDILSRVSILLESDLFAYEGRDQHKFKRRLFERHRHYLERYTVVSAHIIGVLNDFLMASSKFLNEEEIGRFEKRLCIIDE